MSKMQIIDNAIWFDDHKVAEFVEGGTTPPMVMDLFKELLNEKFNRRWY